MKYPKLLVLTISTAFLAACGGGGSDSGPVTPTATSFPVQQALTYAYTNGLQQTLNLTGTASSGGSTLPVTGSLTFTRGKGTSATFNGTTGFQSITTINGSLSANGQSLPLNTSTTDYVNAVYAPIGYYSTGYYCVTSAPGSYPATATAGQTGNVVTFNCFTDSTKNVAAGSETVSYVTTAGSAANTLNVKFITTFYNAANQLTDSGATTYAVTSAGIPSLTRVEAVSTSNGATVTYTAQ